MKFLVRVLILVCPMALLGCSYISSSVSSSRFVPHRDKEYLSATSIPPLQIPPGLDSSSFQTTYPVSDRQYPYSAKDISIIPPGLMDKNG